MPVSGGFRGKFDESHTVSLLQPAHFLYMRPSSGPPHTDKSTVMSDLIHRVRVFPYSIEMREPAYLLARRDQGIESCWGPLQGEIGLGEQMEGAILRQVQEGMGQGELLDLIDLKMPARWLIGDEEIIEWNYGCQIQPLSTQNEALPLRWERFAHAYPSLELETDRAAILRLHALLRAA